MKFQKGNKLGGRKKFEDEIAGYKETLKKQTLEELAKDKVYNHLKMTRSKDRQGVKEIALPVYLKSKPDKVEGNIKYQPIYDGKSIQGHKGDKEDIQFEEKD